MSFSHRHGSLPDRGTDDFYYNGYTFKPEPKFVIRANGQFSDASIVPSFLKNQIFEFEASGERLENITLNFTGFGSLGLANSFRVRKDSLSSLKSVQLWTLDISFECYQKEFYFP